jgi:hypothetical protein
VLEGAIITERHIIGNDECPLTKRIPVLVAGIWLLLRKVEAGNAVTVNLDVVWFISASMEIEVSLL